MTSVEKTVEGEEVSKSKKNSEYYKTPEFDMAFSLYKRLIFIVLKQKEAKLSYPILLAKLKEYKNEIEIKLQKFLYFEFMVEFGNDAEYAKEKVDAIIKNEGFLENLITTVQRGGFFDVFSWANVNNLPLSSELQKELFINTKTIFDKYYFNYKFETYKLESDISKIINEYSIVTLLYDLDVKTIFLDYLQFFLYANIMIDNNNDKLAKPLDAEEIDYIHNKIITPLEKYPSFIFQDLHNARISIEKSNELDRMDGAKLNLSIELGSSLDNIPQIIQVYLLEYYRLSGLNSNNMEDINKIIEFLETLYNEDSLVDKRNELLSLSIMLLFYEYSFEDYVNEKHIVDSVNDMKVFYRNNICGKSPEEKNELENQYRLYCLEKNIYHAGNNKKKLKTDDFFSFLESLLKDHENLKLSKKSLNSIDFVLDDLKFKKGKSITKDAFSKLKIRTLTRKSGILQKAIDI